MAAFRTTSMAEDTSKHDNNGYSGTVITSSYCNHQVVILPLFPLPRVVMSGGRLPLRVFERRYLEMVRDCLKNQTNFGVCLIADVKEVGVPGRVFPYGTLVEIIDWDRDENELLIVVTQGVQKFRTINTTSSPNGLLLSEVELLPPAQNITIPAQYSDLVELLQKALLNLGQLVDYTASDFKEAVWVGNRLVEALPMSPEARHALMIIDDPIELLDALQKFINNWQI